MGSIRDAETTRARILAAALDEFGRHGAAGARVDRIAHAARVNKRMLYHYFGDKAQLYAAALESALASGADEQAGAGIGERLDAMQRAHAADPAGVRLLMWEALAPGGADDAIVAGPARRAASAARVDRLRARQRAGGIAIDCDAAQLELSFAALAMFPFAFPQLTRLITGAAPDDAKLLDARRALFMALARLLEREASPSERPPPKPRYRLAPTVT